MNQEPFFLVNEFIENERKELENIVDYLSLKEDKAKTISKAVFLRNFSNLMFNAYRSQKGDLQSKDKESQLKLEKLKLLRRKEELLTKLNNIKSETSNPIVSKITMKPLVAIKLINNQYLIEEPQVEKNDLILIQSLESSFPLGLLDKPLDLKNFLKQKLNKDIDDEYLDKLRYYLIRDLKDFKEISPLIQDNNVKEIICNGPSKPVSITYKDNSQIITNLILDKEVINNLVNYFSKKVNVNLTSESPFLNTKILNYDIQANISTDFLNAEFVIAKK